ncbi:MAG: hypothetical protein QM687_15810 [Ferruginibacter sp.]
MKPYLALVLLMLPACCLAQIINPALTAVYENKQQLVKLKWQHNDNQVRKYILQRSTDTRQWQDVYTVQVSEPEYYQFFSYFDTQVSAGKSYYRLKMLLHNSSYEFTQPLMVIIGQPGNGWLMYPVPVKDVLNLQYNGNALIPGVISVVIQRMNGQVYQQLRFASSTRLISIPVSNLGSGIYDIRIIIQGKVVWNQRFVK